MTSRGGDLITIPESFWRREGTVTALRARAVGQLFALLGQYTGASQTRIGIACGMSQGKVSDITRGKQLVETLAVFERIADGFDMPDEARILLGLAPRTASASASAQPAGLTPARDTRAALGVDGGLAPLTLGQSDAEEAEDPVRRRTFVGITGASLFSAMLPGSAATDAEALAAALAGQPAERVPGLHGDPLGVTELEAAVDHARDEYQACRYSGLISHLPDLLARLDLACAALDGEARGLVCSLSADAYHVAAGLLLKMGDHGLAALAADRSMRAAQASEDPVTVGASARIVTHALMSGGHLSVAVSTAAGHAQRLAQTVTKPTPESLSVYGSLLLRGAAAAAQSGERDTAYQLLSEADRAGQRLGVDANRRWTAFGPTNARQHRVNVAVALGDAGTAVDVARGIDLSKIRVTERKASLYIDTARAFLQWGKHDQAYTALRAAEKTAPEEVSGRPSVRGLVRELAASSPPTMRREAQRFATQIGALA